MYDVPHIARQIYLLVEEDHRAEEDHNSKKHNCQANPQKGCGVDIFDVV
jgi:hypothetical protein